LGAEGAVVAQVEIPADEGIILTTVYRNDYEVTFKAFLSTRPYSYVLKFQRDSSDAEVTDYFRALTKPDGLKLCQVRTASV
jgi:hypothetical protein